MDTEPQTSPARTNDADARESRRKTDDVIDALVLDVHDLKRDMIENTKTTKEVRDILTSFKMVGKFARWIGLIVAAVAGAWAAVKGLRG